MTIEFSGPEVEELINQHLQSGAFKDAQEVILEALRSSVSAAKLPGFPAAPSEPKDMVELFAPLRALKDYLVDTNVPSELTRERPDGRVAAFLQSAGKESGFLSVMTIGEICKGIEGLPIGQKRETLQGWLDVDVRRWFAGRILPVTKGIAERWGHLAARAKQRGSRLAVVDGVIAAALEHGLAIVTRNVKDFVNLNVALSIRGTPFSSDAEPLQRLAIHNQPVPPC